MNGIIPLYKPTGMTSHDCVFRLRKITGERKIGHTGTLDPGAEGVLPICLGTATKVVSYMSEDTKRYEAEVLLGVSTETEDRFGNIVEEKPVEKIPDPKKMEEALAEWTGTIEQIPPMYSAIKVNGRRLYEYAREGIEVERPVRKVTIFELNLLEPPKHVSESQVSFRISVHCSKGTYIRTLGVDIGKALGYPAHVSRLKRTASGPFSIEDCLSFEEIETLVSENKLKERLLAPGFALRSLPKWTVDGKLEERIYNGAVLPVPEEMQFNRFTVYNEKGCLLAVYKQHPSKPGMIKPEKVFHS